MKEMWKFAQAFMKKTQTQQKKQIDKHHQNIDFKIDDNVWISIKSWKTERSSKKLDNQQNESYEILEKIGNSYRLDLSQSIKMHSIFSSDRLQKAITNSLSEQIINLSSFIEISDEQEWKVNEILTVRLYKKSKKLQYRTKWIEHDDDSTWYDAVNFNESSHCLRDFHKRYSDKLSPSKNLDYWMKC